MSKSVIPTATRRDLWVASGGRCEFRGCNQNLDRSFITRQKVTLGEFCHIIADSPGGPRGDVVDSPLLAVQPSNLIVCCTGCHKTIDDSRHTDQYPASLLRQMKEEHERHIDAVYSARVEKRSIPLILTAPINGTPISIASDIARAAVLLKTGYRRFPSHEAERIDLDLYPEESDPRFFAINSVKIRDTLNSLLRRVSRDRLEYLDVFAIAHIPFLIEIGYLIGDRVPCTVHQAQRGQLNPWLWPEAVTPNRPSFSYHLPERLDHDDIAIGVSISGRVAPPELLEAVPQAQIGSFSIDSPSPYAVDGEDVVESFRRSWMEMLTRIHERRPNATIHLFPAVPNSIAVEMGRSIHPHASPKLAVWNKQSGVFLKTLSLPFTE